MATTLDKRTTTPVLSESHRKVHDPLHKLRRYIRTYVISEALTTLLVCLAVFFWVSLALDYGSFAVFGLDWVKDMPRWLRAVLLASGLLFVGFVVEIGKSLRLRQHRDAGKEAPIGPWLTRNPWAMVAAFGLFVVLFYTGWVILALLRDSGGVEGWLVGLVFGGILVAFTSIIVIKRLLYEFSDNSLAIVLERRFPKILGDRLITAVELNDPALGAKYGYSAAMIEQTIHEAARRVDQLNLREVFDWKRLYIASTLAIVLTIGAYILTMGGMVGFAAYKGKDTEIGSHFVALNDNAGIWAERNVLLDNERWLTRSIVVLEGFPASGEMKIGRGVEGKDIVRADLKARAIEFARHDRGVPLCWRAATVKDAQELGVSVLDVTTLPASWQPMDASQGWTIDELKIRLQRVIDKDRNVEKPGEGVMDAIQQTVNNVIRKTEESSMTRTLRRLMLPRDVVVKYTTEDGQTKSEVPMVARENNEYTAIVDGLTQSIVFRLHAEDFRSDDFHITLVPPPRVARMESHEEHPAYLYHLADRPEDDMSKLTNRKQKRRPVQVDVLGSIKPKVEVPIGADVTLVAVLDKDLNLALPEPVRVRGVGSRPVVIDKRNFTLSIPNVRSSLELRIEFVDTDGAPGIQDVTIEPRPDESPDIRQFKPEVVRQLGNKYIVTPDAIIPFSMDVIDDAGISSIDYLFTVSETPSPYESSRRAARVAAGMGLIVGAPEAPLTSYMYLRALPVTLQESRERIEGKMPLAHFQQEFNNQRRNVPKGRGATWNEKLDIFGKPSAFQRDLLKLYSHKTVNDLDPYLLDHDMDIGDVPFLKGMDIGLIRRTEGGIQVPLRARDNQIQRQYDMEVRLEVRDTNIEKPDRGKKTAPAGVPIQFMIVSEVELLYEIGQEEQRLYDELNKSVADLKKGQEQMQSLRFSMPPGVTPNRPINFDAFSVQVEEIEKAVNEGLRILTKVHVDYDRILRELRTNRISNRDHVNKIKTKIVKPLRLIRDGDFELVEAGEKVRVGYPHVRQSAKYLRETLDSKSLTETKKLEQSHKDAQQMELDLKNLVTAMGELMAEMAGLKDRQALLKQIVDIEVKERDLLRKLEEHTKRLEKEFFE